MTTRLICEDCGGVIGHLEPGESPCTCYAQKDGDPRADVDAVAEGPDADSAGAVKRCVLCNKVVSGHRRLKDSRGYICLACAKAEQQAEKAGKVRCRDCRKLVRPAGLVNLDGRMVCRKCYEDHKEINKHKIQKFSTHHYDAHERRRLMVLGVVFVILAGFVVWGQFVAPLLRGE